MSNEEVLEVILEEEEAPAGEVQPGGDPAPAVQPASDPVAAARCGKCGGRGWYTIADFEPASFTCDECNEGAGPVGWGWAVGNMATGPAGGDPVAAVAGEVLEVDLEEEEAPAPVDPAALAALEEAYGMPVVYSYTRRQAVAEGMQVLAPANLAAEAGFKWPVYITAAVWESAVKVPAGVECQDETGRLWDILWLASRKALAGGGPGPVAFVVYVRNSNEGEPEPFTFYLQGGAVDIDDPAPCITIMTQADL